MPGAKLGAKAQVCSQDKPWAAAHGHVALLERSPARVKTYFYDPRTQYAA